MIFTTGSTPTARVSWSSTEPGARLAQSCKPEHQAPPLARRRRPVLPWHWTAKGEHRGRLFFRAIGPGHVVRRGRTGREFL